MYLTQDWNIHRFVGVVDAEHKLYNRTNAPAEAFNGILGRSFAAENGRPEQSRFAAVIKDISCEYVKRMRRIDLEQEEKPQRGPANIPELPPDYLNFCPPSWLQFGDVKVQLGPLPPQLEVEPLAPPLPPAAPLSPEPEPVPENLLPPAPTPPIGLYDPTSPPKPEDDLWVECGACLKWRKVPMANRSTVEGLGEDGMWTCHDALWMEDVASSERCDVPSDF